MSEPLKISIITVNLNNKEGLQRTIKSVLNQTWKDFEYIVIDGASIDGSIGVLEDNSAKLSYWISEKDNGIYSAMNKGINIARGEYLLFINSGDELYHPKVLQENIDKISDYDIIYFNICLVKNGEKHIHQYPKAIDYKYMMKASLGHPSTFIKKNLFDRLGLYDESLSIVADWKFFFNSIIRMRCTYMKIDSVLSVFYMDGISSKNTREVKMERAEVINKDYQDYQKLMRLEKELYQFKKSFLIRVLIKLGLIKL
ncbi:glycosyltransferase family 2 protein [Christiangramia sabulilitoris]|uniref:Glycosyltransferase n=1 Tax=Christiangramia sabulilitoris TaxID=2583991 RepID=A0A550HZ03_9FLAO|nr:glycosyltransferase family 2 protein [Christiangramia sabulilitoris]TRO63920.1 glycosyltransferase [Christiangramia sabulilitoris]